jgi:hypothetical protein
MLLPAQWTVRSVRVPRLLAVGALVPLLMTMAATTSGPSAPGAAGRPAPVGSVGSVGHDVAQHGTPAALTATSARAVFLAATLSGRNEVPAADPDGSAVEVLRIQGDQVCFATRWAGINAPVAHHIHAGAAGVNGPVNVLFFGTALPATLRAVAGCVTVANAALLASITGQPQNFYVNIHTADFPGGAVRGQLHRLRHSVDLRGFVHGRLVARGTGAQEVPAAGDVDGRLLAFVTAARTQVRFAVAWTNIATPVAGHIHAGARGVGGPVVVPFFAGALPPSLVAAAGVVDGVDAVLIGQINRRPSQYYVNLHNADFPAGAVRGQLSRA